MRSIILLSAIAFAGCASSPAGVSMGPAPEMPAPAGVPAESESVVFMGVELPRSGSTLGGYYDGMLKVFQTEIPLTAETRTGWSAFIDEAAVQMLDSAGYSTRQVSTVFRGDNSARSGRFALAGRAVRLRANHYGKLAGHYTETELAVRWELLDRNRNEVVYSRVTAANARASGIGPQSFQTAFRSSVAKLLADPELPKAVSDKSVAYVGPESSDGTESIAGTGTGFYVSSRGHLLTNAHVVDECSSVTVAADDAPLQVVRIDSENDLAVLLDDSGPATVAVFRAGRGIRAGDDVVAIGYPLSGLLASEANVTTGGVSALAGLGDDFRFLQITAPVQPGNSGGPLLDSSGNVVGIVTSKLNAIAMARATGDIPQNVNFAVNASVARILLDALGVEYAMARAEGEMSPADIGDMAKGYTVLLECRR